MEYRVRYIGKLTAQQRPLGVAKNINGRTIVKQVDRKASRDFKSVVHLLAEDELIRSGGLPINEACKVTIATTLELPASMSKKKRAEALAGMVLPTKRPDLDNLAKGILDAFNKVLFADDKLVTELHVTKRYGINEGFVAIVETIEPEF